MTGGYAVTAQFYDALRDSTHDVLEKRMMRELAARAAFEYPIMDIGAGTGLSTAAIAKAVPHVEILAVEPDPAMRPALMTRIVSDPDLRKRVSILPMSVLNAPWPRTLSAVVASASIVHFSPEEREVLWSRLARHLAASGCAFIEIQCPVAVDIRERKLMSARVGQVEYEVWASASRVGADRQGWRMTYVARWDEVEIDRQTAEFTCWTVSAAEVIGEAAAHGFASDADQDLVILSRA